MVTTLKILIIFYIRLVKYVLGTRRRDILLSHTEVLPFGSFQYKLEKSTLLINTYQKVKFQKKLLIKKISKSSTTKYNSFTNVNKNLIFKAKLSQNIRR